MSKIIYIAGLGHSGSTMLDLALGTKDHIIGLGEIRNVIYKINLDKHASSTCSCGKIASDCVVWSKIRKELNASDTEINKYESVLQTMEKIYGSKTTIIDTSKNSYPYLKHLNDQHDLKLIYLTRDVRSWSYSRSLSTGKPILYFSLRWFLENQKILLRLKKMQIPMLTIGYEELALYPEHVLKIISEYLNEEYTEEMLSPINSNSHIISGNIARADKEKRKNWVYDARWLVSGRILLLSPLFWLFKKRNNRYVYSKVKGNSPKDFYLFGTRRKKELDEKYN